MGLKYISIELLLCLRLFPNLLLNQLNANCLPKQEPMQRVLGYIYPTTTIFIYIPPFFSNTMTFYDERLTIRIQSETLDEIRNTINKTHDRYDSELHFIRAAIQRHLRFEKERNYQEETNNDITHPTKERTARSDS